VKQVIAKTYAAFFPAHEVCRLAVQEAGTAALGADPWLFLEGGILRIAWEGIYFPLDEVLQALNSCLPPDAEGKLDYLDLEAWTLTRHVLLQDTEAGTRDRFAITTRGLNHVLAYSGH
jgi:hypothetical protein